VHTLRHIKFSEIKLRVGIFRSGVHYLLPFVSDAPFIFIISGKRCQTDEQQQNVSEWYTAADEETVAKRFDEVVIG